MKNNNYYILELLEVVALVAFPIGILIVLG